MLEPKLTVSVVVIAYNAARYLERALECVYSQSRLPDEVILVDDGSTDETRSIAAKYPSVRYFYQENEGPSAARNRGAATAVGDVLAFLDVDDLWEAGKLQREVAILERDAAVDIVQGQIVDVADTDTFALGSNLRLKVLAEPYHFVNLGSLTIRKDSFTKIGPFDVSRKENEDTDWFLRAWESGSIKELCNQVSLYYTIREDSLSGGGSATSQCLPRLLKQHRDRAQADPSISPKGSIRDFFVSFPDRSKRVWEGEYVSVRLRGCDKANVSSPIASTTEDAQIEQQFKLARVWKKRGRWKQALQSYRRVVELMPSHVVAHVEMGQVIKECGDSEDLINFYRGAIELFPNEAEMHKAYIDAFVEAHGIEKAFDVYDLKRLSEDTPSVDVDSLVCVFVCRNEARRLPYFLKYYREKGVTHFFAIDNGSTDGTREFLMQESGVFLWGSDLSFNRANFGSVWFELVLRAHALGCWCVTVDVDELLVYPDCESVSLKDFCATLDKVGKRVLPTVLLEMYSKEPVAQAYYSSGNKFLDTCSYFDSQFYHSKFDRAGPFNNLTYFFGGVRERVFGENDAFCQSKVSLVKYDKDCILAGGQHWTNLSRDLISKSRGCLLHFKYFSDFEGRVKEEVERQEHYQGALQYKQYIGRLDDSEADLSLYDPEHSVRFSNSQQLVDLGIMKRASEATEKGLGQILEIPKVASIEDDIARPLWSVIVTVYDRVTHLPRCLESILKQALGPDEMQIEVVADMVSPERTLEIRRIVETVGEGRVSFYPSPSRLGHPRIFNLCLERAVGHWVHIVHDDDWLAPEFYTALGTGIRNEPNIGAAFSRYALMGKEGETKWMSCIERKDPGVVEDWLDRIGVYCRLAFSSMVVRRSAYERLGGFSPSVGSAFDWDMWKRVAVKYPVWFEPRPLSYCGREGDSLTDGLMMNGEQIDDSLLSIELTKSYWPENSRTRIVDTAREHYAEYAMGLAKQQLAIGEFEAAFKNISSGLKASRSKPVQTKLIRILADY